MDAVKKYEEVLYYLPKELGKILAEMPDELKSKTNEIRLRRGKPLMLCGAFGCCFPLGNGRYSFMAPEKAPIVSAGDVEQTAVALCGHSVYSHQEEINAGYISFGGGNRAGISGTAVTQGHEIKNVRFFNSINIRIAKNINGCAQQLSQRLYAQGLVNTIIFGAPMTGKTTILKDLVRILSSSPNYYRTTVVDERCELDACEGVNLDFFRAYPKAEAIEQAVRAFSPRLIVADEIGTDEECDAVLAAMDCGVKFIASVHCGSVAELLRRPLGKKLIASGSFERFVALPRIGAEPQIYNREVLYAQMCSGDHDFDRISTVGDVFECKAVCENLGA